MAIGLIIGIFSAVFVIPNVGVAKDLKKYEGRNDKLIAAHATAKSRGSAGKQDFESTSYDGLNPKNHRKTLFVCLGYCAGKIISGKEHNPLIAVANTALKGLHRLNGWCPEGKIYRHISWRGDLLEGNEKNMCWPEDADELCQ